MSTITLKVNNRTIDVSQTVEEIERLIAVDRDEPFIPLTQLDGKPVFVAPGAISTVE